MKRHRYNLTHNIVAEWVLGLVAFVLPGTIAVMLFQDMLK